MAKRRKNQQEEPREETRKQARLRTRDWERNKQVLMYVVPVVALALLLVLGGAVNELLIKPGSVLAKVENNTIITRDFWKRARLQEAQLREQLFQYQLFSQQFGGGQDFFASQIAQLQATLASPISLGTQVMNEMIDDEVVKLKAAEMGVTVGDEEVEEALREEVAARQGALTVPQATATAEAGVAATATAASFTPTPTSEPTVAASDGVTDTAAAEAAPTVEAPTPEPPTILDETLYQEGLTQRSDQLKEAGMSLDEYREVLRVQLLREKMVDVIGSEQVTPTEEQAHARHILIRIDPPAVDESTSIDQSGELTNTVESGAPAVAAGEAITDTGVLSDTAVLEDDGIMTEAEALALATELRQRILDGEDFAALAAEYSDDPGSGANGGDLGWAKRGAYVPEFDEAVFSLPIGETSEPIKTQFGYHLIQVIERDTDRPKDESTLAQEKAQAFQSWLQEQVLATPIERPENLPSKLPSGLGD